MPYEEEEIYDPHGKLLEVGDRVVGMDAEGEAYFGAVTEILEIDGDVDDEGRSYGIPPGIAVKWEDGTSEIFRASDSSDYRVTRNPHWIIEEVTLA
jgi:hypothetical protein